MKTLIINRGQGLSTTDAEADSWDRIHHSPVRAVHRSLVARRNLAQAAAVPSNLAAPGTDWAAADHPIDRVQEAGEAAVPSPWAAAAAAAARIRRNRLAVANLAVHRKRSDDSACPRMSDDTWQLHPSSDGQRTSTGCPRRRNATSLDAGHCSRLHRRRPSHAMRWVHPSRNLAAKAFCLQASPGQR